MGRDPKVNPKEGDVLYRKTKPIVRGKPWPTRILVDKVENGVVYVRTVDAAGGLYEAFRISLDQWREAAPLECI